MERKTIQTNFEVKSIEDSGYFEGYASVFNVKDFQNDIVKPAAFKNTIAAWQQKDNFPPILFQHKAEEVIGRINDLTENANGLFLKGQLLFDIPKAREVHVMLKNKLLGGMSIGFIIKDSNIDYTTKTRNITDTDLKEVSLVTFPANEFAVVTRVKSQEDFSIRDFERLLRDAGFSNSQSKAIASAGYRAAFPDNRDDYLDEVSNLLHKFDSYLSQTK